MKKFLLVLGSMSSLVGMAPVENVLKVSASKLPFNPFVPRASWVVKKSVLSDALTPAMTKALSAIGIPFTRRPALMQVLPSSSQESALIKRELNLAPQLPERLKIDSVPNFSIIIRALSVGKGFEMNSLVMQELVQSKNKTLGHVQSALPVVHLSSVDRGDSFLLTMSLMQEDVIGGKASVLHTEMGVTQASWLRVTRPMLIFSLIDRLFRASLITSSGSRPELGDLFYDVRVIVDSGLLCSVEQETQTEKSSKAQGTQTKAPKSKQTQTRNLATGSLFDVKIVDNAETQTDFLQDRKTQTRSLEAGSSSNLERENILPKAERQLLVKKSVANKIVPRKYVHIRSESYCGVMEYILLALFFIMLGLSDYKPYAVMA